MLLLAPPRVQKKPAATAAASAASAASAVSGNRSIV
jgi:hypothetical protein